MYPPASMLMIMALLLFAVVMVRGMLVPRVRDMDRKGGCCLLGVKQCAETTATQAKADANANANVNANANAFLARANDL